MAGLPETVIVQDLQKICESDLSKTLGLDHKLCNERPHPVGLEPTNRGNSTDSNCIQSCSRQVIMRFLVFNDKTEVPRTYRKNKSTLKIKLHRILIFEDFSAEIVKQKRAFSKICPAV